MSESSLSNIAILGDGYRGDGYRGDSYLPEGYPKESPVLKKQVLALLRKGASEIAAAEEYLASCFSS